MRASARRLKPGGAEAIEDADVRAEILVDVAAGAVLLTVTNKTDQVLQIDWAAIALTRDDGIVTSLRPDVDLGWLQPQATVAARLFVYRAAAFRQPSGRL